MKLVTWPRLAAFLYALLIVAVAPLPSHAIETEARNVILLDDVTGLVLFEKDADAAVPPSSMSKIMTVYMVFQRLAEGTLKLDDSFVVSEKAWRKCGSKMFVNIADRVTVEDLLRGSIGVEQLHGPVGIVHIGARIADRGFTYLIFFLAIISVNLAVINFLPIPIVDGGLFLFLVYEKLKGRAPSPAFQNAATIVGLAFIATVLLVGTWNDLTRLLS